MILPDASFFPILDWRRVAQVVNRAEVAAGDASLYGEVAPGEVIRGQVGSQVPLYSQALQFF